MFFKIIHFVNWEFSLCNVLPRNLIDNGGKNKIMELMSSENSDIQEHALVAIQKIMI